MEPGSPRNAILYSVIAVLALAGIVDSAIALQRHYARSKTDFCEFNQKFSCDIVNRSEYSSVVGIPVAAIGIAGYAVLFVLAAFRRGRAETQNWLLGAAFAGLAFALYLTYLEAYVLTTWCILCLVSLCLIALITLLAGFVKWKTV